mmetsp:Transcript_9280/g.22784  ORF Transcript_9280/g.22784 Transcript_9280/m.22784 type:complete len:105 (+) Transcript_9280:199-513(+)
MLPLFFELRVLVVLLVLVPMLLEIVSVPFNFIDNGSENGCFRSLIRFPGSTRECFDFSAVVTTATEGSDNECLKRKAGSTIECLTCRTTGSTNECLSLVLTDSI